MEGSQTSWLKFPARRRITLWLSSSLVLPPRATCYLLRAAFCPELKGVFKNGIIQTFVTARTLTPEDFLDDLVLAKVAKQLRRLHQQEVPGDKEPMVWTDINRYIELASAVTKLENPEEQRKLEAEIGGPVIYAHNDMLPGNVMVDAQGKHYFIDFEYSRFNYCGTKIRLQPCSVIHSHFRSNFRSYPNNALVSSGGTTWDQIILRRRTTANGVTRGLALIQASHCEFVAVWTLSWISWIAWRKSLKDLNCDPFLGPPNQELHALIQCLEQLKNKYLRYDKGVVFAVEEVAEKVWESAGFGVFGKDPSYTNLLEVIVIGKNLHLLHLDGLHQDFTPVERVEESKIDI
ncbi:hypothetical protein SELMODRAFT_426851 [Selaginella moellendorffii]|uniref:ethanolamine kinase n=1 Tax=Selaginella moellendorffii TaxID=88036 RepID=D8SXQ2_SELML|nr:hypothetical protein SELMODRAFT_426851 [Selaginella moellendorffii]